MLHPVAFIPSTTEQSYGESLQTVWKESSLPFLAHPEVLTPGENNAVFSHLDCMYAPCTSCSHQHAKIQCAKKSSQCKIHFLLKKAPAAANNSTGDQF